MPNILSKVHSHNEQELLKLKKVTIHDNKIIIIDKRVTFCEVLVANQVCMGLLACDQVVINFNLRSDWLRKQLV